MKGLYERLVRTVEKAFKKSARVLMQNTLKKSRACKAIATELHQKWSISVII